MPSAGQSFLPIVVVPCRNYSPGVKLTLSPALLDFESSFHTSIPQFCFYVSLCLKPLQECLAFAFSSLIPPFTSLLSPLLSPLFSYLSPRSSLPSPRLGIAVIPSTGVQDSAAVNGVGPSWVLPHSPMHVQYCIFGSPAPLSSFHFSPFLSLLPFVTPHPPPPPLPRCPPVGFHWLGGYPLGRPSPARARQSAEAFAAAEQRLLVPRAHGAGQVTTCCPWCWPGNHLLPMVLAR